MKRFVAACVLLVGACLPVCAQDVCKVTVRAYVTTNPRYGHDRLAANELPADRFQPSLKPPAPVSLALRTKSPANSIVLLDRSESMEGLSSKLTNEAVESVLRVMSTQDGIRVAVFGELSAVATNLEAARKLVSDLPTKLATRGRTALWDAIEFRSRDFGEQGGTMLVVSDCGDNLSEISAEELDRELRRRRVQVSFITLDEAFPQSLLDETGARDCLWLSSRTGGLTVRFQKLAEMDAVIRKLLRPYVFELTVPRERATSKWKLKVTGNKPALRVTAPDRLPGCDD